MEIEVVRRKLSAHTPARVDTPRHQQAAVAVVLREGDRGSEVLLIERAIRDGDPWSGHMAFPGGRREPGDPSTEAAARRETLEEIGLPLDRAEHLGRLDDLQGNPRVSPKLVISAHAFHLPDSASRSTFVLDPAEVQDAFWFPLAALHERSRWVTHGVSELPDVEFPGVLVGEPQRHVVWGLTYRFLDRLFHVLEHPFPDRWREMGRFVDR